MLLSQLAPLHHAPETLIQPAMPADDAPAETAAVGFTLETETQGDSAAAALAQGTGTGFGFEGIGLKPKKKKGMSGMRSTIDGSRLD